MGKSRSVLLACAAAVAALLMGVVPSTASADAGAASSGAAVRTAGQVAAAVDTEYNQAVEGTPPSGLSCAVTTGATACFEAEGDKWWVRDTAADSASAEAGWQNIYQGSFYRAGVCRNSLGYGTWGVCNKNYYENSTVKWAACVYDGSAQTLIRCSARVTAGA
ncbi:hypothetical protein [Saccharothrix hoggarensis]|uniref:Secreted protein n=1 Tax=Saccharothrix hoggarensis TaxID=913853 RepID=A0ABW3QW45_9PSEU